MSGRGLVALFALTLVVAAGAMWFFRGHAVRPERERARSVVAEDVGGIELRFEGWTAWAPGVEYGHGSCPMGRAGRAEVDALRIRLDVPGVELVTTEGNGDAPRETEGETAVAFAERTGVLAAVNAHFFEPCCNSEAEPKDVVGLAVSDGVLVSPPVERPGLGECVFVVDRARVAAVLDSAAGLVIEELGVAVAGSHVLLRDGVIVAPADSGEGFQSVHPRTAIGVSADGREVVIVTIDGRQIGWSNGATLRETAAWLRFLGADDGVNLDGGGSTTMVRGGTAAGVEVVNRPVGRGLPGSLRWNGSHLGVRGGK